MKLKTVFASVDSFIEIDHDIVRCCPNIMVAGRYTDVNSDLRKDICIYCNIMFIFPLFCAIIIYKVFMMQSRHQLLCILSEEL